MVARSTPDRKTRILIRCGSEEISFTRMFSRRAAQTLLSQQRRFSEATPPPAQSFIEKAKVLGANALLGLFTHKGGFDRAFDKLKIIEIGGGKVICTLPVDDGVQNAYKTLHGGAIATLVDIAGTLALLSQDPTRPGVSVELNTSFVSAAKSGDSVKIVGQVLKAGKKLGFTEVEIFDSEGKLVATGRHTKAL